MTAANPWRRSRSRSNAWPRWVGLLAGGGEPAVDDYDQYDDGYYYDGPYADYDLSEYAY
jgi:hypothetical protein